MAFRRKFKRKFRPRQSNMAQMHRRRRFGRVRSAGRRAFGSFRSGMLAEAFKGLGAADIADDITDRFAPQWSSIARIGAGFAAGGVIGGAVVLVKDLILGQKIPIGSTQTADNAIGDAI